MLKLWGMQSTQGTLLDHLRLVAREACVLGSHGTVTIIETALGKLPPLRHCTDSRLKHISVFLWKRPMHWSWGSRGTGLRFVTHLAATECPEKVGQGMPALCSPSALLWFASNSQKRAYTLVWSPKYCKYHPSCSSRSPGLEVSRIYDCSPTELYIFEYFESCCMRIWLPISLEVGAKWMLSLEHRQALAHPQQMGHITNKSSCVDNQKDRETIKS